jgi:hypothetical protein
VEKEARVAQVATAESLKDSVKVPPLQLLQLLLLSSRKVGKEAKAKATETTI